MGKDLNYFDQAIWRRFAYRVRLERPEPVVRKELFQGYLGDFAADKEVALFAAATEGLTGAEIRQIAEDAKRTAILAGQSAVDEVDVLRRAVRVRAPEHFSNGTELSKSLRGLRDLNEKVFTYRRLAEMFGVSVSHVSNLLKRKE